MLVCIVFRFVGFREPGTSFFFYMLTIYLLIFIAMFVAALFKVKRITLYFTFLNSQVGRGFYIVFITLLILEKKAPLEIILGILLMIIAVLNVIVGCG